jgi:hypothetical protein
VLAVVADTKEADATLGYDEIIKVTSRLGLPERRACMHGIHGGHVRLILQVGFMYLV